jgi:hypothetical protein
VWEVTKRSATLLSVARGMLDFDRVHHLYISAGRYETVRLRTPSAETACLCRFMDVGEPL